MTNRFKEISDTLDQPRQEELFVQKRDTRVSVLEVFVARKVDTKLEALLVFCNPQLLSDIGDWPQSEGFHVIARRGERDWEHRALICLELSSSRFRDVFFSLAEDLCRLLSSQRTEEAAVKVLLKRLYDWQRFLKRFKPEGLSLEAQVGLFGELDILRSVFLSNLNTHRAIQGWRGCKKANQDFQFPDFALEVKTTTAVIPERVFISNVQQLDDRKIARMYLGIISVHRNEATGISLPGIISQIRGTLDGQTLQLFNEGLIEVGYLDTHESTYEKALYQLQKRSFFAIVEGFPRFRIDEVPKGILSVKYSVSIDACRPFETDMDSVIEAVSKL